MDFAYLVISCSKTQFVRNYCLMSLKQCGIKEDHLYVTLDNYNDNLSFGKALITNGEGFIKDTIHAVEKLKNKYTHVVLILDDFIFKSFKTKEIFKLFRDYDDYDYLRLTPSEYVISFERKFIKNVPLDHPYYSSLQVASWRINYLIDVLENSDNIWDVEKQKIKKNHKYVSTPLVNYRHVVEKGKWDRKAKQIINDVGFRFNSNGRSHDYLSFVQKIKYNVVKIILIIFGYKLLK